MVQPSFASLGFRRLASAWPWVVATLAYALVSQLSWLYFSGDGDVSIFWPPAGVALAMVLRGGTRYAVVIALGSFWAYATQEHGTLAGAAGLAVSSVLEALAARWLALNRDSGSQELGCLPYCLRLCFLSALLGPVVGALSATAVLTVTGVLSSSDFVLSAVRWWMGDALSILLLTPLLLVWSRPRDKPWPMRKLPEAVMLLVVAFFVGQIVYFGWFGASAGTVVGHYWMFLIVAWIAVRLGLHGTVLVLLMVGIQGLIGTYELAGMSAHDDVQAPQINFWFYMLLLSTGGMSLAAHFADYQRLTAQLLQSKHRQDAILDAIPDLLFEVGLSGHIYSAHARDMSMLAVPVEQVVGRCFQEQLPCAASAVLQRALDESVLRGYASGHQFFLELVAGRVWFEISVARMAHTGSQVEPHFIMLLRDISERKKTEIELRIAALAFEGQEAMMVADAERRILRVNQAFTTISGFRAEEVLGKRGKLMRAAGHDDAYYEESWKVADQQGRWQGEVWGARKNGDLFCAVGTLSTVRDHHGELTYYVRTFIENTQEKLAEEQRREQQKRVYEALIREVHHRIKNNLQGVTGVLRRFATEHPEVAAPISQAIGQVQSIAAVYGLPGPLESGEIGLVALVQAVSNRVEALWQVPIELNWGAGSTDCGVSQSDAVALALAFNELLSNAIKHGSRHVPIRVRGTRLAGLDGGPDRLQVVISNVLAEQVDGLLCPASVTSKKSSGLALVAALLAPHGARLTSDIENSTYTATLALEPPAIRWMNGP